MSTYLDRERARQHAALQRYIAARDRIARRMAESGRRRDRQDAEDIRQQNAVMSAAARRLAQDIKREKAG